VKFREGDRVRVINKLDPHHGYEGTIVRAWPSGAYAPYDVQFPWNLYSSLSSMAMPEDYLELVFPKEERA
jgi:hypothetical protein